MDALKSSINAPEIERQITAAFRESANYKRREKYDYAYEHGQWWVSELGTGRQWSVVDAGGPGAGYGYDFELVSEGE